MLSVKFIKVIYYLVAVTFCLILFGTYTGNYFHGGTPIELIALQGAAVLILLTAIKLLFRVGNIEKIIVILFAAVPAIFTTWSILSMFER